MRRAKFRALTIALILVGCHGTPDSDAGEENESGRPLPERDPAAGGGPGPNSGTSSSGAVAPGVGGNTYSGPASPTPPAPSSPATAEIRLAHMHDGTTEGVDLCLTRTGAPATYGYRTISPNGLRRFSVGRYIPLEPGAVKIGIVSGNAKAADCAKEPAIATITLNAVAGERTTVVFYGTYHFDPDSPYWEDHAVAHGDRGPRLADGESVQTLQFLTTDRVKDESMTTAYASKAAGTVTLSPTASTTIPQGSSGDLVASIAWSYPSGDDDRATSQSASWSHTPLGGHVTTLFSVGLLGPATNADVQLFACDDLAPPMNELSACTPVASIVQRPDG